MKTRTVVGTRTIAVSAEVTKAALSALTFLILAVRFGPEEYGIYVQYAAIAAILVPIATLAFSQWVQPMTTALGIPAAVSAGMSVFIFIALPFTALVLVIVSMLGQGSVVLYLIVLAEMVVYPLWSALTLCLLAGGRPVKYLLFSASVVGTKLLASIFGAVYLDGGLLMWSVTITIAGMVGLLITSLLLGFRTFKPGLSQLRQWMRRGFSYALVGLASSLTDNVDKIILGQTLGAGPTGTYGAGSKVASYGAVPVKGLAIAVYPRYFSLAESGEYEELRALMHSTIRRGLVLGSVVAIAALGAVYAASRTLLASYDGLFLCSTILAVVIPIRSIQYGAGDVLYAVGKSQARLTLTVAGAFLSGGLILIFASFYGLLGAAVGILVSSAVIAFALLWLAERSIESSRMESNGKEINCSIA